MARCLRHPRSQALLTQLRTADRLRLPLSTIRDGRSPAEGWLPTDRMLAVALTIYQDDTCPGCGHSKQDAWGTDHDFSHGQTVCSACAAIERETDGDGKRAPGAKDYAVDETDAVTEPGEVPPTFG